MRPTSRAGGLHGRCCHQHHRRRFQKLRQQQKTQTRLRSQLLRVSQTRPRPLRLHLSFHRQSLPTLTQRRLTRCQQHRREKRQL